jgi:hypothetical protein
MPEDELSLLERVLFEFKLLLLEGLEVLPELVDVLGL